MAFIIAISCDSSDSFDTDIGKKYFPLQTGRFMVYDVVRTTYDLGIATTSEYELKTVVIDSFPTSADEYTYVLHRSTRDNASLPWTYVDTWSVRNAFVETVVSEGNLPVVNLKYPVRAGFRWNANSYNTKAEDEFEISSLRKSETLNAIEYADCLTVLQNDNQDYIVSLDQRKEIYARDIGLVYKDSTVLFYCTQPDCLGQEVVEDGVIYTQTIKAYGFE